MMKSSKRQTVRENNSAFRFQEPDRRECDDTMIYIQKVFFQKTGVGKEGGSFHIQANMVFYCFDPIKSLLEHVITCRMEAKLKKIKGISVTHKVTLT